MVDGTETIEEHLSLTPAPGHSPGHVLINLSSQGSRPTSRATSSIT